MLVLLLFKSLEATFATLFEVLLDIECVMEGVKINEPSFLIVYIKNK